MTTEDEDKVISIARTPAVKQAEEMLQWMRDRTFNVESLAIGVVWKDSQEVAILHTPFTNSAFAFMVKLLEVELIEQIKDTTEELDNVD